ncbi:MAG: cellulose synthase, partial [Cyanobacteria bacterium J069]
RFYRPHEIIPDPEKCLLDAKIIRAKATPNLQVQMAVQFLHLSRTQIDDLVLVLYSDVKEWYSQKRQEQDNPVDSFKFIAASIGRVFREFRPESNVAVRKQVKTTAYLFWEGWGEVSYPATLTELGGRDLRLELETSEIDAIEELQVSQPLLSLLVLPQPDDPHPESLIARVVTVEVLSGLSDRTVLELSFPAELDRQQQDKIRRLLRSLN